MSAEPNDWLLFAWHRLRLAWFTLTKGLPVSMEYPNGERFEWKRAAPSITQEGQRGD